MGRLATASLAAITLWCWSDVALANGGLRGRVLNIADRGVGGVRVTLDPRGATRITDRDGSFGFERLGEGLYSLTLSLGGQTRSISAIAVTKGTMAVLEETVDWQPGLAGLQRLAGHPVAVATLLRRRAAAYATFDW